MQILSDFREIFAILCKFWPIFERFSRILRYSLQFVGKFQGFLKILDDFLWFHPNFLAILFKFWAIFWKIFEDSLGFFAICW